MNTGDGGRMDDASYVYVVDCIKDMIVSGGENMYFAEGGERFLQHPAAGRRKLTAMNIRGTLPKMSHYAVIIRTRGS